MLAQCHLGFSDAAKTPRRKLGSAHPRLPPQLPPPAPRRRRPDETLFAHALRHNSCFPESNDPDPVVREAADLRSNRRLEWEGDTVLCWFASVELARQFPIATSGDLSVSRVPTTSRSRLTVVRAGSARRLVVSNRTLSHLAWAYGFGRVLEHNPNDAPHRLAITHQKILATASKRTWPLLVTSPSPKPSCAPSRLSFATYSARTNFVPLLSPSEPTPDPSTTTLRGSSITSPPLLETASEIGWLETQLGGKWSTALQIEGETIVTAEGTKRQEARQRVVDLVLTRLWQDPQGREVLRSALRDDGGQEP
ncbi:RNase III domain-containing protein [Rhodotorula toruloides]|uniref:RNase III domain-containing protein n=1 Tax=Rhodotorula toruloides TaxID=5286 RepID=A0A2T0ACD8_RHOTO|nr:RNase III domain-containing protein [Rhodotorula toruloides]PRQ75644.1 hypothetical protein AAT19DRAFT_13701 [Rhodotorula toruloides]